MRVLYAGQCMIEFPCRDDRLWQPGFRGTLRASPGPCLPFCLQRSRSGFLTRIGMDSLSDRLLALLDEAGTATGMISRDTRRCLGLYTIETDPFREWQFNSG